MSATLQENLTGIRVVRAFARQDFEREKFDLKNRDFRDKTFHLIVLLACFWSISDLICTSQLGTVLIVGGYWAAMGDISVGTLYAFFAYIQLFLWPVRMMGRVLIESGKTLVALGRIHEILSEKEETAGDDIRTRPTLSQGAIAFENVHFTYPAAPPSQNPKAVSTSPAATKPEPAATTPVQPAVDGISFHIAPGKTVALLGPSGAGKSTLIRLLLRLYEHNTGSITLDGVDIRTLERAWLRSQVAVIMQEPFLFSKTLRENIKLGHAAAGDEAMYGAAAAACIHESIDGFEKKYDTVVGERGVTLSGGQRQRVAIARALLMESPVLVLDDALSAVDTETESFILEALRKRRGQRTTLLIAHRISTLMHADEILVLEHGRIIQRGSHTELLQQEGLYKRLWQIQTSLETSLAEELLSTPARGSGSHSTAIKTVGAK